MATIEVYETQLRIVLTAAEKFASLRSGDIVLERDAITAAVITHDPWVWIRGMRVAGTHMPRTFAAGLWRSAAGRDFVLARKGRDAVALEFAVADEADTREARAWTGEFDRFARVVCSTEHPAELMRALHGHRAS